MVLVMMMTVVVSVPTLFIIADLCLVRSTACSTVTTALTLTAPKGVSAEVFW